MHLLRLHSTQELRAEASAWNDLWLRSQTAWPTMRAEPLAQWLDAFQPDARQQLLIVEDGGRWVAALPLYGGQVGPLATLLLPGGDLCSVGDLLLDECQMPRALDTAMDMLVAGLCSRGYTLARFDAMFPQTSRWRQLLAAAERRHLRQTARPRGVTGTIELSGTWEQYFASRSRNLRRQMRVAKKRAEGEGRLALQLVDTIAADTCEPLLRRGFEVEDRSWKAEGGTSTLRTPGAFPFFVAQAKLLLQSGHLLLAFLTLEDQPIAFEYGWQSKGTYHSLKVGYDEGFAHLSPGQLLRCLMLEAFFAERKVERIDFLGPLSEATAKWATGTYPVGRWYLGTHWLGRLALALGDSGWRRRLSLPSNQTRALSPSAAPVRQ